MLLRTACMIMACVGSWPLWGVPEALPDAIEKLIKRYSREITVLEIGKREPPYLFGLMRPGVQCVALCVGGVPKPLLTKVEQEGMQRVILLGPPHLTCDMLCTLGSCEHCDVIIVHDLGLDSGTFRPFVNALLRLGDHIIIEAASPEECTVCKKSGMEVCGSSRGKFLFYAYKQKKGLTQARFTQKFRPSDKRPVYRITSSFDTKLFSKAPLFEPIPWIQGINLVTFTMLGGVYPMDAMIRKQLTAFKKSHSGHNDLVLGNIIVRGTELIPIDYKDGRRSGNSAVYIMAALKAFKIGNKRLKNPKKWIDTYYESL